MDPIEEFNHKIPTDFAPDAKVWVYQSPRDFGERELLEIREQIDQYVMQWQSHGKPVHGYGDVYFGNTLIFIGEETDGGVSGCSTDGMVRLVQSIARQYSVELFDRMSLMFYVQDKYQRLPLNQVKFALEKEYLAMDTLYFDVSVHDYAELRERYIVPLEDSWVYESIRS